MGLSALRGGPTVYVNSTRKEFYVSSNNNDHVCHGNWAGSVKIFIKNH
jgi:hypothetical protein